MKEQYFKLISLGIIIIHDILRTKLHEGHVHDHQK